MKVFVPKAPSEIKQEVVFKVSVNGGKWKALHSKEEQPRISIAVGRSFPKGFSLGQEVEKYHPGIITLLRSEQKKATKKP